METIAKDKASPSHQIIHRHMQRRFEQHRDKLEKHKLKGAPFRAAVEELEKKLFSENPADLPEGLKFLNPERPELCAETYQSDTDEHTT